MCIRDRFHTDRGSEFNNSLIDDVIATFDIRRSLSLKGCPYDNAVAESTFKIFKAEFVYGRNFPNLNSLKMCIRDRLNVSTISTHAPVKGATHCALMDEVHQ